MLQTLAPKDIDSINQVAGILIIPFIAAAVHVDFGMWPIDWFTDLERLALIEISAATIISFIISIVLIAFAIEVLQFIIYRWAPVVLFSGIIFLTIGVLGLHHFKSIESGLSLNIFWHLGFLAWGLDIFSCQKITNKGNKEL